MSIVDDVVGQAIETEVLDLYRAHLSKGRATLGELFGAHVETASSGAWLSTSDGEQFLNCGGYGVFIMGARHPVVMEAVERQLAVHPVATRILLEPTVASAAKELTSITPAGLDRVHFALSGAEAIESALKLARANGRKRIVSTTRGYHGKSLGALSATAKEVYQRPFRPLLPDVVHVEYGNPEAMEAELVAHPGECCVLVEPVQGEGGVRLPPPGYLRELRELCDRHGGILVFDEVQTGLGRLGEWWGADIEGVVPDILACGKALGGGVVPVSAIVADRATFSPFDKDPYIHTGTFSGAPLLMAGVEGAIRAIKQERLVSRADELGGRLLPEVRSIVTEECGDEVVEIRGRGLLIGVEFHDAGLAGELLIELFNHGVVANHSMNESTTVRFTPPAILSDTDVEFFLGALRGACRDLLARRARMPKEK